MADAPAKGNSASDGGLALVRGNGAGGGPHDLDAERAVLGALLLHGRAEVVARVRGLLVERDFFLPWHTRIFAAILKLSTDGAAIDPITVAAAVKTGRAHAPPIGEIHALTAGVLTAENIEHYATIVRDCSLARDLIATLRNAITSSIRARDMESVVASLETAAGAARSRLTSQAIHAADIIAGWARDALAPTHRVGDEWYSDRLGRMLPAREFCRRPDEAVLAALDRSSEALEGKPPVTRSRRCRIYAIASAAAYYRVLDSLQERPGAPESRSDADTVRAALWRAVHAHRSITPAAVAGTRHESIYAWCERSAVFGDWIQVPGYHAYAIRLARSPSAPIQIAVRWPFIAETGLSELLSRFASSVAFGRYLTAAGIGRTSRIQLDRRQVRVVELLDIQDAENDPLPAEPETATPIAADPGGATQEPPWDADGGQDGAPF